MKNLLPDFLDLLETAGYEASAHATKGAGSAREAAARAAADGFDLVVAAGGDGTVFEVVNGLAPAEIRPCLGLIPGGTTNDFARALRLPADPLAAARQLVEGRPVRVDVGQAGENYFINIAAAGAFTELTYDTPLKMKTLLGQLAYYLKGMESLPDIAPLPVRIEYDGQVFEEEILLFLLANTPHVGGFEQMAPLASYQDGLFDLLVVKSMNFGEMVQLGGMLMRGEHYLHPRVLYAQARSIRVQGGSEIRLNLDGEYGGTFPVSFRVLERHLEVMTPKYGPKVR